MSRVKFGFGGGQAFMRLTDPDDSNEDASGIEIVSVNLEPSTTLTFEPQLGNVPRAASVA